MTFGGHRSVATLVACLLGTAPAVAPAMPAAAPPVDAAPAQAEVEAPKAEASSGEADKILTGQVQALWESGDYAQAMILVDAILTAEPANASALGWQKKIRTAQQAEAALR